MRSLLVGLVLALSACGGGHSPTEPTGSIAFVADRAATAPSFFLRAGAGTNANHLQIEVVANEVNGIHSVSFALSYPIAALRFTGQGQGSFLNQGGVSAILIATPLPAPFNGIVINDVRPNAAPGVSGSGVVMRLEFEAVTNGTGTLEMNSPEARNSQDQPIAGIAWIGGTATVIR